MTLPIQILSNVDYPTCVKIRAPKLKLSEKLYARIDLI